ncbi:MAG: glycosyltransferase [Betaproteobacteria bacterium]|nr:glycosyltransferase [Betaproteobacteria bacterium]
MADRSSMPQVVIVSPYLRAANNGNWRTAERWRRYLAGVCDARIVDAWPDAQAAGDQAMIALHARRSAAAISAWHAAHPGRGLAVVLTGTDLYRDIHTDAQARRSLDLAQALVTLQEQAPRALPAEVRGKARVIYQSVSARPALAKTTRHLRALAVGHLREEKSPDTLFAAACLLSRRSPGRPKNDLAPSGAGSDVFSEPGAQLTGRQDIRIDHIGAVLDPALAKAARATMRAVPHYRWLGGLPHEATRRRIQRAHLLVHPSRMEGGAHVIIEAVVSGTPVLASRIDGNVGMLGEDYAGYFEWGDAQSLAALLLRCRADAAFLDRLRRQCQARAPLFEPATEAAALGRLVEDLLEKAP